MYSDDSVARDCWQYFPNHLLFPQNDYQTKQTFVFRGISPRDEGLKNHCKATPARMSRRFNGKWQFWFFDTVQNRKMAKSESVRYGRKTHCHTKYGENATLRDSREIGESDELWLLYTPIRHFTYRWDPSTNLDGPDDKNHMTGAFSDYQN